MYTNIYKTCTCPLLYSIGMDRVPKSRALNDHGEEERDMGEKGGGGGL